MANPVLLNNIDHKDLRIDTRRAAGLGDDVMFAPTFPAEFRNLQTHYPIVFRKAADGVFQPIVLFGFEEGQNLFIDGHRWTANYLPLAIVRQPFLIGKSADEFVVHIDLDSPRVVRSGGEALFREHGGTTDYLDGINSVLLALHTGLNSTPAFVAALLQHDLLESFAVDVELSTGAQHRLAGFYTINEERLGALGGAALEALNTAGYLEPIYMALASQSNFQAMIARMDQPRAAPAFA